MTCLAITPLTDGAPGALTRLVNAPLSSTDPTDLLTNQLNSPADDVSDADLNDQDNGQSGAYMRQTCTIKTPS